jgi:hypothetical protein
MKNFKVGLRFVVENCSLGLMVLTISASMFFITPFIRDVRADIRYVLLGVGFSVFVIQLLWELTCHFVQMRVRAITRSKREK